MASDSRRTILLALLFLAAVFVAATITQVARRGWQWTQVADPPVPTILFVVLDTVRSDHLSLCGYGRPTSPTLERLRDTGAAFTCDAIAPGSWTLPTHASFFTGLTVPEHGAHFAATAPEEIRGMHITPLPDGLPTLAEQLAARGYQTAGLSANPVLIEHSGLARGFEHWVVPTGFGVWYRENLTVALDDLLDRLQPDEPLFLFINISDAHDPWFPVPDDAGWVSPRREGLQYFPDRVPREWEAYVTGSQTEAEDAALIERVTDLYDWGVFQADANLDRVLARLEARGWTRRGMRLVVASDHGEFLGEHRLLRHGRYLWEPNNRVPILFHTTGEAVGDPVDLSGLRSASVVYDLVLDGTVGLPRPVIAAAYPDSLWISRSGGLVGASTSAGWWEGSSKWQWMDGTLVRYDLAADPEELRPLEPGPLPDGFSEWVAAVRRSGIREGGMDPDLAEALKAAGYLDGDEKRIGEGTPDGER